jgi:hypothetical protein
MYPDAQVAITAALIPTKGISALMWYAKYEIKQESPIEIYFM